jgi:hypothetical protein
MTALTLQCSECGLLVEVKRLGIKFGGEMLDPFRINPVASRAEGLAYHQVF